MKVPIHHARGFTLIEMLVVVAIIGVLASVAFPSLAGAMERGRRAEINIVRAGISNAARDKFMRNNFQWPMGLGGGDPEENNMPWNPPIDVTTLAARPNCNVGPPTRWDSTSAAMEKWKWLEWEPEGLLRARYRFQSGGAGGLHNTADYQVIHVSDLDGDGECGGHMTGWSSARNGDWVVDYEFHYGVGGALIEDGEW